MSAILSTDTLNDFISPSVACIKPIETLPQTSESTPSQSTNEVQIYDPQNPLPQNPPSTAPAQISLTDCLACSGCVTSAEAVLVSLQSHTEVLNALDSGPSLDISTLDFDSSPTVSEDGEGKIYIASISPQTIASIAATLSTNLTTATNLINQFLCGPSGLAQGGKYNNKFQWLVNTDAALSANLVLGCDEVLSQKGIQKPILSSSCPGWICYAEKTHPHILPHLSRLKSPQALTGTILKTVLSKKYGISADRIWHVAIMPCFDKKLEASREELTDIYWDGSNTGRKGIRDVDCVITSKELLMLAATRGINFSSLPRTPLSPSLTSPFPDPKLDRFLFPNRYSPSPRNRKTKPDPAAGTSGGHLWFLLSHISTLHPSSTIHTTRGRNADVIDYTVTSPSGEILFKAARYYGFRNIQNLVRRLKPARASRMPGGKPVGGSKKGVVEQGYVEVMACPGGCTNGGGQIKADDDIIPNSDSDLDVQNKDGPKVLGQKEWLAQVDEAYFSGNEDDEDHDGRDIDEADDSVEGISPSYVRDVLAHWAALTGFALDQLVYTSYREVISDVGKKVDTTERVVQLAGKVDGGW